MIEKVGLDLEVSGAWDGVEAREVKKISVSHLGVWPRVAMEDIYVVRY